MVQGRALQAEEQPLQRSQVMNRLSRSAEGRGWCTWSPEKGSSVVLREMWPELASGLLGAEMRTWGIAMPSGKL